MKAISMSLTAAVEV